VVAGWLVGGHPAVAVRHYGYYHVGFGYFAEAFLAGWPAGRGEVLHHVGEESRADGCIARGVAVGLEVFGCGRDEDGGHGWQPYILADLWWTGQEARDRKSTRLNSSH